MFFSHAHSLWHHVSFSRHCSSIHPEHHEAAYNGDGSELGTGQGQTVSEMEPITIRNTKTVNPRRS